MPITADEAWDDRLDISDGLMNAATGIALGIALGLSGWVLILALLWVTL